MAGAATEEEDPAVTSPYPTTPDVITRSEVELIVDREVQRAQGLLRDHAVRVALQTGFAVYVATISTVSVLLWLGIALRRLAEVS
jgi:hypothetical protein